MKSMFQVIASLACALALTACGGGNDKKTVAPAAPQPAYEAVLAEAKYTVPPQLKAEAGDLVTISYDAWVWVSDADAKIATHTGLRFETASVRSFVVGTGNALVGLDQGILTAKAGNTVGMKVGDTVHLVLPSSLAYGATIYDNGKGVTVPANTPVILDVTLLAVTKAAPSTATLTQTDTVIGTGAEAVYGKVLTVDYTGWLYDPKTGIRGAKFDSSLDTGKKPFDFSLGQGVILGWTRGVAGMKVGGKRTLIVSPELGYGSTDQKDSTGVVTIPAGSTLLFDIELKAVK
ncbi:MAG: FKBP-type peptidyl-prolyl cis-trans isomerase [Pseudomonadota bacterium]